MKSPRAPGFGAIKQRACVCVCVCVCMYSMYEGPKPGMRSFPSRLLHWEWGGVSCPEVRNSPGPSTGPRQPAITHTCTYVLSAVLGGALVLCRPRSGQLPMHARQLPTLQMFAPPASVPRGK